MWTSELQVVILAAGRGSRMTELIGNTVPKCLIPVAGNPLIFYPMKALALNGFAGREVLVITQDRDDIRKAVELVAEKAGLQNVETFPVEEDSEDFGTAESLRLAISAKKITKDVLIISCDLIGELPIKKLLQMHGLKASAFTALFIKNIPPPLTNLPGPRSKVKQERDIVGVKTSTGELVFMASEADLDEELALPVNTLLQFPYFKIFTWLTDSHIYILRKNIIDKLFDSLPDEQKHLSLKGEFLPWIIQKQLEGDIKEVKGDNKFVQQAIPFYCLLETENQCIRVNSIRNYAIACQSVEWMKKVFPDCITRSKETKIEKSSKLVATSLGDHCNIGTKCRLTNVIGMDHIKVETNCEIQNSIISSNAIIGANCLIKDCLIGPKYHAATGARHANEHLTVVEETFFEA